MPYNYGECEICNTKLEARLIKQDFWISGRLVVIENVLAGVCPQCGEKVVKGEVGRRIAKLLQDPKKLKAAPKIRVPVVRLA